MRVQNGKLWSVLFDGEYEVRSLTEADLEESLDLLDTSFFTRESVCKACEIDLPENKQARQELRELARLTAYDGYSLVVKNANSGQIVSVSFNKLQFLSPPGEEPFFIKFLNEQVKSPQAKCLMAYMINMDEKVDIFGTYKLNSLCELMFLGTLAEYGGRGFGLALAECTVQLTREFSQGKGLEDVPEKLKDYRPGAVSALWTSKFTQKIGQKAGFKVLARVPYSEYEFNNKRFNERIESIHEFGELVILKL